MEKRRHVGLRVLAAVSTVGGTAAVALASREPVSAQEIIAATMGRECVTALVRPGEGSSTGSTNSPKPAVVREISYLGACPSGERGNEPLCNEWCVGEVRQTQPTVWRVQGRGQLVGTGTSPNGDPGPTVWTFATINSDGSTQSGNEVVRTGRPCR